MKATVHDVIVRVESRLVEEINMGKTKLYFDPTYDMNRNTKIKGEVVSVPHKLKGTVLYSETEGFPPYHGKKDAEGKYYPTPHQRSYITMEGMPIEIKQGDIAYFHYLTLSDHNYLGKDEEGWELYKCAYDQLFGYVRDKKFHLVNGWIAVSPLKDETYQEIEIDELNAFNQKTGTRKLDVKMTDSGIIYDTNNKPVFRHGVVAMRSNAADGKDYRVAVGDTVIYSDWSEFKNTIEGVEYYMMRLHDVVAAYRDNKIVPIGYYVLMDATEHSNSKLILPEKYKRKPESASVLAIGSFVEELQPADDVRFDEKEAYYVPVENKRLCFIKYQYIWGRMYRDGEMPSDFVSVKRGDKTYHTPKGALDVLKIDEKGQL
jgi:co-chaperonin GroES (HSP10)